MCHFFAQRIESRWQIPSYAGGLLSNKFRYGIGGNGPKMTPHIQPAMEPAMSFVYDRKTRTAIDNDRGITIRKALVKPSDADPIIYKFEYTSPDLTFEFGAISHEENRKFFKDGKEIERHVAVSIDVIEGTLGRTKPASQPLSPEKISEVKETIKEGMFALCAQRDLKDDSLLVPEFKVNFIAHAERVARTPLPFKHP